MFNRGNNSSQSRNSSVSIALGYGLDDRVSRVQQGLGIFLITAMSRTALGPIQHPIQWVPGALSLGVKWPGPPSSAEVKECVDPLPHYAFMVWCLVKYRDNFTFTFKDSSLQSFVLSFFHTSLLIFCKSV